MKLIFVNIYIILLLLIIVILLILYKYIKYLTSPVYWMLFILFIVSIMIATGIPIIYIRIYLDKRRESKFLKKQLPEVSSSWAVPRMVPPTVPPPYLRLAQLRAMTPAKFEEWIASKFNNAGYQARVVGGAGDDGIDIEVRSAGVVHFVVQAKRYSATNTINPEAVRGFRGAMTKYPEATGYLVTTGSLTPQASAWVRNQPITVVDAKSIERWNPPPPELAD